MAHDTTEQPDAALTSGAPLSEEQADRLVRKLDKEADTRRLSGGVGRFFFFACLLVSAYHLYTSAFGPPATLVHRSLHVAMILALGFLMYPFSARSSRSRPSVFDWLLAALSFAVPFYIWYDYLGVVSRAGAPNQMDMAMATLLVVLVLESARRITGKALVVLSLIFIAYGLFGRSFPGMFMHRGYDWASLSNHFFANTEGIYGTSVSVAASYIFLFIVFGAVMKKCGMGQFFNDIALAVAGHTKGGPAKVAVIASGFLGSINGAAVANVVTTGAFTIPLMKKIGYSREFAGAVEATASVGGQLLPPIMGAAAFIMAEMISVPYSQIIIWALLPALLYYLGIIFQVHLRASKDGLIGMPREQLPRVRDVLSRRSHLLLPIAFLLYMLFFSGTTVIFSAVLTIAVTIVVSMLRPETRMSFRDLLDALAEGAQQTVSVAVACAVVGIIIGVSSKTGFGLTMANTIITLGRTSLLFTLVFTMITCMVLGMGLPSIPAYIITATIAAPALAKLNIPVGAAHMFSFYFAMFANLTPPVALASFAAAGLSGGDPMRTGIASVRLAIAGFIVPFMFVYAPQLMLINTTVWQGLLAALSGALACFLIAVAVEGHLYRRVPAWLRLVAAAGALVLMHPGIITDAIGLAALALVWGVQKSSARTAAT